MLLCCTNNLIVPQEGSLGNGKNHLDLSPQRPAVGRAQNVPLSGQWPIDRIRKMFGKVELSVSSYDTAWVAMVPSRNYPKKPFFPDCLDWVLENQNPDGSWGLLNPTHPLLVKDSLSSTLACLLALQKWNVGERLVNRGLDYIGSNSMAVHDKSQYSPIGFEIVFPGMINSAKDLGLDLPLEPSLVDAMLRQRDLEIKRGYERGKHHLGYVAEGLDKSYPWKELMKCQRNNGSLFNSPSATAAALLYLHDDKCFEYLHSVLEVYENAVPTVYPLDTYTHLCMVDRLERLGIDKYFRQEIQSVLYQTYRCWLQKDEDIVLDVNCCAMAFRLLRQHGFEVSSDALFEFDGQEHFFNSVSPQFTGTSTVLELYRASLLALFEEEPTLEKLQIWTSSFLKQQLLDQTIHEQTLQKEVEYALKHPHSNLERVENRKSIEQYNIDNFQTLKTSYRCSNIDNKDFLETSVKDYNLFQAIHRDELEQIERWVKENRLDHPNFVRQKQIVIHFLIASLLFSPDLTDARMAFTKNSVIGTILDDFFDNSGSSEELLNIIELIEKWDEHKAIGFCSEQVEIMFRVIYDTVNEIAAMAFEKQGRCIKNHLIELWRDFFKFSLRECERERNNSIPSVDEYLSSGLVTAGIGLVVTAIYLLGPKLSKEAARSVEYKTLFEHSSIIVRLCNDVRTMKKEREEERPSNLLLYMLQSNEEMTEEEAVTKVKGMIEIKRRELLRLVYQTKGSLVPRACKDFFWMISKQGHYLYLDDDGLTSSSSCMIEDINAVFYDPISLNP